VSGENHLLHDLMRLLHKSLFFAVCREAAWQVASQHPPMLGTPLPTALMSLGVLFERKIGSKA
jgi:hypothetical protein